MQAKTLENWLRDASNITKETINAAVLDFVRHPYRHRCEQSVHVSLYAALAEAFGGSLAEQPGILIKQDGIGIQHWTSLVHKEWPVEVGKPSRGNLDLAVLNPTRLAGASVIDFLDGRPPADIAIEVGLDDNIRHLEQDEEKLIGSGVENWFAVHLDREPHYRPALLKMQEEVLKPHRVDRLAFAYYDRREGKFIYKLLGSGKLEDQLP